ncbi:YbbR domain-containing protein [Anaerosolibacter carboniphilus]|uniref:YbbR domain-containing protein n=1 Tax=Anaerosolibacter carboniphilus TaxID=1417629 RepID=A0A841KNV7_9FIRM|nr:CdaR family protein [Anaerosolibacter carboniphilus]MBB6215126.1 YbbR domain-containing protein [Anaerosolibacter carboniphilus]
MNDFIKNIIEKSRFFSRNTTPKIISIIFALVMWLYVMGEVNPEMVKEFTGVKVQLLNVETLRQSGLTVIGQEDFTVNVKINGRRNDVYTIRPQDITISADLRGFEKGVNSVPLKVNAPASINYDIYPNELKVSLDEIVKRQKPVEIITTGVPPEGFDPAEAEVALKEVIVEGPESFVRKVEKVIGEVNFDNKTDDFTGKVPLKAVDEDGKAVNGVEVKTKYVDVNLPLYSVKEVKIALELVGNTIDGYDVSNISIKPEVVSIKGPRDLVKGINEIKTKPVNVDGLVGAVERPVELILPTGISLYLSDKTPVVSIAVEKIEVREISYEKESILIDNLDEKYKATFEDGIENITVRVEGPESVINGLDKSNIQLHINAKDIGEGRHSVRVTPKTDKTFKSISVIPEKIEIMIKMDKDTNQ